MRVGHSEPPPGSDLERRVAAIGRELSAALHAVLDALGDAPRGPQALATALGLDKVLVSRLLKALRDSDPMAAVHRSPGPEPLRRLLRAAKRRGVPAALLARAGVAVDDFERLIRDEAGDRSALGAILSAWLPEAREEFELRRKQSLFKAISQLKGVASEVDFSTALLAPSADGTHLDVVWVMGQYGVRRLRPGATVKFVTRRLEDGIGERRPTSLDGEPMEDLEDARLDQFCHAPPAPLEAARRGESVLYTLGDSGFGPRSTVDVVIAEVNRSELRRYVPAEEHRRSHVFAEVSTPVRRLVFDVHVHRDVFPGSDPDLIVYDTAGNGIADPNDPARDVDRFDVVETVKRIGTRAGELRAPEVPKHLELMRHVYGRLGWDPREFRAYRCRSDYPIYGTQLCIAFEAPAPPR